jgi:hypothetical protein
MKLKSIFRRYSFAKSIKGDFDPNMHNYNKNIADTRLSYIWEGWVFLPKRTSKMGVDS